MAIYHCSIKIISRGKGKSAVAAAAYRAGEKILNDYDGQLHDFTRKGGVVHTEIFLSANAPSEYEISGVLWNAVEKIEKAKNSQLAREIELALPVELSREQNISLVREYVKKYFVSEGMCADIAIHDKGDGNPHAHIMLTMRPFNDNKTWGDKQKKEYVLDQNGQKIYDPKKRQYKCKSVPTTDWNEQSKAEEWREGWANTVNTFFENDGIAERLDHRSYERQGIEQIPAIHLGVAAAQMERKGIVTERGNINRQIEISNKELRQLRARINKLNDWLKEKTETVMPTLTEVIQSILSRREYHTNYQKTADLRMAADIYNFLTENGITDMAGLTKKVTVMRGQFNEVSRNLKEKESRLKTLDKHIDYVQKFIKYEAVYVQYQREKNPKKKENYYESCRADITLFLGAKKYLDEHMNGKVNPKNYPRKLKEWKTEKTKITAEKNGLYNEYHTLKAATGKIEIIKRNVDDIIRSGGLGHAIIRGKSVAR